MDPDRLKQNGVLHHPANRRRRLLRTAAPLLILSLACAFLITIVHNWTADRIAENRRMQSFAIVREVMPLEHDNDLLQEVMVVTEPAHLGSSEPVSVFRARRNGVPVGLVLLPVVARGYSGRIELAVGISYDGAITGVRIARHNETEGLGDRVHQSRSGWILGFAGRSLANTAPESWAVSSDGGNFDQISGATISPRGVINVVRAALEYYDLNRDRLYATDQ